MRLMLRYTAEDRGFTTPCWIWEGTKNRDGYARCEVNGRTERVHRVLWEITHGALASGYHVHHKCGVRECVNSDHLAAITAGEHARIHNPSHALTDRCKRGHLFTDANVVFVGGYRKCRACRRMAEVRYYEKMKALAPMSGRLKDQCG
jgi:hypothetical protein